MRTLTLIASALLAASPVVPLSAEPVANGAQPEEQSKASVALLNEAFQLIKTGQPAAAIERLDKVIAYYDKANEGQKRRVYCASSQAQVILYMSLSASRSEEAVALDSTLCDAIFGKGFALIDMGQKAEARILLERAVELSPYNSQYIAELAELKKSERDWSGALEMFERAASAAEMAESADQPRLKARAWRGIGFARIELGDLDKAEAMFRKCLKLDPNDRGAQSELQYIKDLRKQQPRANAGPPSQG